MTDRDSEQVRLLSGCKARIACFPPMSGSGLSESGGLAAQVPADLPHQVADCFAAVVPGDVRMHLAPEPLDVVVVGTVRRQEVQSEPVAVLGKVGLNPPAGVDAVVVQQEMKRPEEPVVRPDVP